MSDVVFEPVAQGFVRLEGYQPPGEVTYYEFNNHERVDGKPDFYRLNYYLSCDGEFVNVWWGLLDPVLLSSFFEGVPVEPLEYEERLFRGWLHSKHQGEEVLGALRLKTLKPQTLKKSEARGIVCELLPE